MLAFLLAPVLATQSSDRVRLKPDTTEPGLEARLRQVLVLLVRGVEDGQQRGSAYPASR